VVAYSVEEHFAVLKIMLSVPNSFNASASLMEWRNVHQEMCKNYYLHGGTAPRSFGTLHEHKVEVYNSF
jgi:hypothetical protein